MAWPHSDITSCCCHMKGRAVVIATGTKLLDTKYTFYEFGDNLHTRDR